MGKIVLGLAAPHNPNITSRPDKMSPEVQGKLDSAFRSFERSPVRSFSRLSADFDQRSRHQLFLQQRADVLPWRLRYLHRASAQGTLGAADCARHFESRHDNGQGIAQLRHRERHRFQLLAGNDSRPRLHGAVEPADAAHGSADRAAAHQRHAAAPPYRRALLPPRPADRGLHSQSLQRATSRCWRAAAFPEISAAPRWAPSTPRWIWNSSIW